MRKDISDVAEDAGQDDVIAFLSRPESYGETGEVTRIETHAAIVFLVGDCAYKLKRAVAFSYLDFSTIAKREAVCRAELALNRRTAPELYLEVRAIRRGADGTLAFDGTGPAVDWIVVMRRFDQDELLDRIAARGALDEALIRELSAVVAAFHRAAEPVADRGGSAAIAEVIDGNERNLALAAPDVASRAECEALTRDSRAALRGVARLLDARRDAGKIRRCHGDLHLRNICLWRNRPTLFDCIEFSDSLSCIDVLYDLAFLLMDLRHRGLERLANLTFNAYLDANDETAGLAALPLFLSLRAAIRAHTGIAAARAQSDRAKMEREIAEARRYFAMAQALLAPAPPRLVAIGGLSGTGKSTVARAVAPNIGVEPGARLLQSDAIRKRLFGVAPRERLPASAYDPETNARVYAMQREGAAAILGSGHSVVVDAVFARQEERAAIAATAREAGVGFAGLWLTAPADVLRSRVARRTGDVSDATVAVVGAQLEYTLGPIDWSVIDAAGTPEECQTRAAAALASR